MKVPDPKKQEIEIFGITAFIQARTALERRQIDAVISRNGEVHSYDSMITIKAIENALSCNLKPVPSIFSFRKRRKTKNWNRLFTFENIGSLTWDQLEFLLDVLGEMEHGKQVWDEIKKKDELAKEKLSQEKPSEG